MPDLLEQARRVFGEDALPELARALIRRNYHLAGKGTDNLYSFRGGEGEEYYKRLKEAEFLVGWPGAEPCTEH